MMKMRLSRVAAAGLATFGAVTLSLGAARLSGQSAPATAKPRSVATPRTPWGAPDLQGNWSFATVTPLQRPTDTTKPFLTADEIAEIERRASRNAEDAKDAEGRRTIFA
jgi:hypothetical protein